MRRLAWAALLLSCARAPDGGLRVSCWAGPEELELEVENARSFTARTGVPVVVESYQEDYVPKLVAAFAAGSPPDVVLLDSVYVPFFLASDVLRDLTPMIREHGGVELGDYYEAPLEVARRGEALYALPKDFTPVVVFFHKALFDRLGVPHPRDGWTWDDFRATAKALTRDRDGDGRPDVFGFNLVRHLAFWVFWPWQNGGDVVDPRGRRARGFLDGPETVAAVRFLADLALRDRVTPASLRSEDYGGDLFKTGRVGMMTSGHWAVPALLHSPSRDFNLDTIGVVGLPRGKHRVTVMYESGWAVARQTRRPREAFELARHLAGEECQERRARGRLAISALRRVAERHRHDHPLEAVFLDETRFMRNHAGVRLEEWRVLEELAREAFEEVLHGVATPEEALGRAARAFDAEAGQ